MEEPPPTSILSTKPADTTVEISPSSTMSKKPLPLTILCALTPPTGGIGRHYVLPWSIPRDLALFKSVTTRLPSGIIPKRHANEDSVPVANAVIMGRRTWESLPQKMRPLRGRWNIIVSEVYAAGKVGTGTENPACRIVGNLEGVMGALEGLGDRWSGRAFVIGGALVYKGFMMGEAKGCVVNRALLTVVEEAKGGEVECDTFFPEGMEILEEKDGWKRRSTGELAEYVGQQKYEVEGWFEETKNDQDLKYEFRLFERDVGEVQGERTLEEEERLRIEEEKMAAEVAEWLGEELPVVQTAPSPKGGKKATRRLSGTRPSSRGEE